MKKTAYLFLLFMALISYSVNAQKTKINPFQLVKVPDSIYVKLEKAYEQITGHKNVNAGRNVFNLVNPKNFEFNNGIYAYKGQGSEFPRRIFIYYNDKLYTFTSNYIDKVLEEYLECIKLLGISERDRIIYLKEINDYLKIEFMENYGIEIK